MNNDIQPSQPNEPKPDSQPTNTAFTISGTLNEAWSLVKGSKGSIWCVTLVIAIVASCLQLITHYLLGIDTKAGASLSTQILLPIVINLLIAPFYAGALMIAIKRARHETVTVGTGFQYFTHYVNVAITMVIVAFIASIPALVINAPGMMPEPGATKGLLSILGGLLSTLVYTFFLLSVPLVADKNHSPKQALSQSIKLISPHWFKVFALLLISYLFILIIAIPFLIGMLLLHNIVILFGAIILLIGVVWLVPFLFLITGNIYHHLVD